MIAPTTINAPRVNNVLTIPEAPPLVALEGAALALAVSAALVAVAVPDDTADERLAANPCGAAALPVTDGHTLASADWMDE